MHSRMGLRKMSGPRGSRWRRVKVPTIPQQKAPFARSHRSSLPGLGTLALALCAFSLCLSCRLSLAHHTFCHLAHAASSGKGKKIIKHTLKQERESWSRRSQPARSGLAELISWVIYFIRSANIECLLCVRHCAGPRGRNRAGMERLAPSARLSSIRGRRWS